MITAAVALLALYFGFWLGRRWEWGEQEELADHIAETRAKGGIRLNAIRIRR
jgi:hypothetical protein